MLLPCVSKLQFSLITLIVLQVLNRVNSFRDYPANYESYNNAQKFKRAANQSVYEKSFQNVLTRNKRSFVFCERTYAIITSVSAKGLLSNTPRAMYLSYENDIFYDMPVSVEGWRKPWDDMVFRMKANMKKEGVALNETYEQAHIGVVNASAIPLDEYNKIPLRKPHWNEYSSNYNTYRKNLWNPNRRTQGRYRPYNREQSYPRYNYQNSQRRNYAPPRGYSGQYVPSPSDYQSDYRSNYRPSTWNTGKSVNNGQRVTPWYHHREYRERRAFYDHIEAFGKMLGKKLRQCVLRAICEMKQSLLPKGESLINDVARILFTVPTDHDDKQDEFTKMAMEENVDCARRFIVTCPHSPLEYFFTNFRATGEPPQRPPTDEEIMQNIIYA